MQALRVSSHLLISLRSSAIEARRDKLVELVLRLGASGISAFGVGEFSLTSDRLALIVI